MLQPILQAQRLLLRPFTLADAPDVKGLAGAREIADTTLLIPHPYEDGMAEEWISKHPAAWEKRESVSFAILLREENALCGAIGLRLTAPHNCAELGYWIGVPYWRNGYATEAASAVIAFGFETLKLNRIYAQYFSRNPASGRVLQKVGMQHEGCLRQHVRRWERFEDLQCYGLLRENWSGGTKA